MNLCEIVPLAKEKNRAIRRACWDEVFWWVDRHGQIMHPLI